MVTELGLFLVHTSTLCKPTIVATHEANTLPTTPNPD